MHAASSGKGVTVQYMEDRENISTEVNAILNPSFKLRPLLSLQLFITFTHRLSLKGRLIHWHIYKPRCRLNLLITKGKFLLTHGLDLVKDYKLLRMLTTYIKPINLDIRLTTGGQVLE